MIIFEKIPDDIWGKGNECVVWLGNDGYVYKAYKKYSFDRLQEKLRTLNSLPEYEKEEICGMVINKNYYVTKLKRLKDWEEIFAENYIRYHRREKDWDPIIEDYMISNGYKKCYRGWIKDNITIKDVMLGNIGMTDDNLIKIIDASLLHYDI